MATATVYRPFSAPDERRHDVAALLQHAFHWTRAASAVVPPVAQQVAPALTVAAQLYEAEQYTAALGQLGGAVTMLHLARQAYPALPEL
jgi:hypothetical protein